MPDRTNGSDQRVGDLVKATAAALDDYRSRLAESAKREAGEAGDVARLLKSAPMKRLTGQLPDLGAHLERVTAATRDRTAEAAALDAFAAKELAGLAEELRRMAGELG